VKRRFQGVTVVELLIVMAILGIIMSVLAAYFVQQTRLTSGTQARNEVEIKVRTVAEIIAQDLQMAGSRIVYIGDTVHNVTELATGGHCTSTAENDDPCVRIDEGSLLTIYYASSLRSVSDACRKVRYSFGTGSNAHVLNRADNRCAVSFSPQPLASNITDVEINFECANGVALDAGVDPLQCYTVHGSFPIQGTVTVTGRSDNPREDIEVSVTLSATMPNLRPTATSE
jgi:prepilin-type N-terminal cleavage/methylation domain-containing protein